MSEEIQRLQLLQRRRKRAADEPTHSLRRIFDTETQSGTLKMRDMKLRDMKMRHRVAGVENARHENAAPDCKGGKCET